MSDPDVLQELAAVPVTKLNIGDTKFRRRIKQAGFETIDELFSVSKDELKSRLPEDWMDILDLKDAFERGPEAFARRVLQEREHAHKASDTESGQSHGGGEKSNGYVNSSKSSGMRQSSKRVLAPPVDEHTEVLAEGEQWASGAFGSLTDHLDGALVAEVFEDFVFIEGKVRKAFAGLFSRYSSNMKRALELCEHCFPDIFVVCVAYMAREYYDRDRLWPAVFNELGIPNHYHSQFKRAFRDQIMKVGLPCYNDGEADKRFFYTALLHAGFSQVMWEEFWEEVFLPAAKSEWRAVGDGVQSAADLLEDVRTGERGKRLLTASRNLLEKAGDNLVLPLFESALSVARAYEVSRSGRGALAENTQVLLSRGGLTSTATDALLNVVERAEEESAKNDSKRGSRAQSKPKSNHAVFLNDAELLLSPGMTAVVVHWGKQRVSREYANCFAEFYIQGGASVREPVRQGPGMCFIDDVRLDVDLSTASDIQVGVRIVAPADDERFEGFVEPNSLLQPFRQTRPGMYEFRKNGCGVYRLSRGVHSSRSADVAYVMLPGFYVEELAGLEGFAELHALGSREDCRVFTCTASAGSSGRVMREGDAEPVCVWRENYKVASRKDGLLGHTADGHDLFGYSERLGCYNGSLPVFEIEANDPSLCMDDVDAYCICDGTRISISKGGGIRELGTSSGANGVARMVVSLQRSAIPRFVQDGVLVLSQESEGRRRDILRYRFSVVPVQCLYLDEIDRAGYGLEARYRFSVADDLDIELGGEAEHLLRDVPYDCFTPLDSPWLDIRFSRKGSAVDASIDLAGIEISFSDELREIAEKRAVNLADAVALRRKAGDMVEISVHGHRRERELFLMLSQPLLIDSFEEPRILRPHLFDDLRYMGAGSDEEGQTSLTAFVTFGHKPSDEPGVAVVNLLECQKGFGCGKATCSRQGDGYTVQFERPSPANLLCAVSLNGSAPSDEPGADCLKSGETVLHLDRARLAKLRGRKAFYLWIAVKPRLARRPDFEREGQRILVEMEG